MLQHESLLFAIKKIGPSLIEYIIDDSHLKQNRFSPGTHVPIVSNSYLAKHKPDVLVVFAYEYIDGINTGTISNDYDPGF